MERISKASKRDTPPRAKRSGPPARQVRQTEAERAYDAIVEMILGGDLRLGERTSVNLLSARTGIGRTPTKDAIIRLEAEGLLSVSERSGTTVNRVSAEQAMQMFAVRHLIEDYCAETAAQRIDAAQLAELFALLKVMAQQSGAVYPNSSAVFVNANAKFHAGIVAASGNAYLYRMYTQLQIPLQIVSYLMHHRNDPAAAAQRQAEHEAIARALEARDGPLLKRLLREHTAESEQLILGLKAPLPGGHQHLHEPVPAPLESNQAPELQ